METIEVKFTLPEEYRYETKINGKMIAYRPQDMHESWVLRFLEKGMQRYANDAYSGEKGETKYDLCRAIAADAHSGKPAPARAARVASLPDDLALAVKNAKQDLTLAFKKLTGKTKTADMMDEPKVAKFFTTKGESVVWLEPAVIDWMETRKAAGKDYLAEAQASLEGLDALDDILG